VLSTPAMGTLAERLGDIENIEHFPFNEMIFEDDKSRN
jgi:hypothetical protein